MVIIHSQYKKNGILYAIHYDPYDHTKCNSVTKTPSSLWFGTPEQELQVGVMSANSGNVYKNHIHKERERIHKKTKECLCVINGSINIKIFDEEKYYIDTITVKEKQIVILYNGYHEVSVLEDDTLFYEFKNGPFIGVEEDKEYY